MSSLPDIVLEAWQDRDGPAVLGTVDQAGNPNVIYVAAIKKLNDSQIAIADCVFHKTRANILTGSRGSFLFITKAGKAFQLKGSLSYHTSGPVFEDTKTWLDSTYTLFAVVVFNIEVVYEGAEKLV